MHRTIGLIFVIACSACQAEKIQPVNGNVPANDASPAAPPPSTQKAPSPDPILPGEPGGLPDDRRPVDAKGAQGAGQVLQSFGTLLAQRKFAEARKLWSDGGHASGLAEAEFIAAYDKYAEIHTEVGTPGRLEGAAGSSYVVIPFRVYGTLQSGKPFNLVGPVTLRRVNDVPGSTDEQRRWHIYRSGLKPRP